MDENFNTMHAHIVCSTDDDNDHARHVPTNFNHASNANNITDTSIVLVTFPLLNIRDQHEDEDKSTTWRVQLCSTQNRCQF